MKRKTWPLLTLIVISIIAGGALFLKKVTILRLENMDHPRAMAIRLHPSEGFAIFYVHSIYLEPVIEEFQVERGAMVLRGVRTKSLAVMEYYGFEDTAEFHPLNQRLGDLFIIRRGMGEGQGLDVNDRKIYLSEIGEKGDRIRLRVESVTLGKHLLDQFR